MKRKVTVLGYDPPNDVPDILGINPRRQLKEVGISKELSTLAVVGGFVGIVPHDQRNVEYSDSRSRSLCLVDLYEGGERHLSRANRTLLFLLALEVGLLGNTHCSLSFRA